MKIHKDLEQRSEEWYEMRLGKVTGSQVKRIMGGRGGDISYRNELIAERLTGQSKGMYINPSMQNGIDLESRAIANYEFITGNKVDDVAFVEYDDNVGCSPDGLVEDDGVIEIKCPDSHTYIKWLADECVPKDHKHQCLFTLWVTGRKWLDFIMYDPRMGDYDYKCIRMNADDYKDEIKEIETKVNEFVEKMGSEIEVFKGKFK